MDEAKTSIVKPAPGARAGRRTADRTPLSFSDSHAGAGARLAGSESP